MRSPDVESTQLQRSIDKLADSVEKLEERLVRKDVYESDQRAIRASLDDLKDDIQDVKTGVNKMEERREAERRLFLTSLVIPALLLAFQIYLASRVGG